MMRTRRLKETSREYRNSITKTMPAVMKSTISTYPAPAATPMQAVTKSMLFSVTKSGTCP